MDNYIEKYINSANLSNQIVDNLDVVNNLSNPFFCILHIFALAEKATHESCNKPWLISDLLNKRRDKYEFDKHLQQMILFVKKLGSFTAIELACGLNKNYYRTLLENIDGYCILFFNDFNLKSKYLRHYIKMNDDANNPMFAYFLYDIDKQTKKITSLEFIIPQQHLNKKNYSKFNLTDWYKQVRDSLENKEIEYVLTEIVKANKLID